MTQSDQLNELSAALAKAQGEMQGASKDSENPFFKSNYADLASVWAACRGPLSKNGLSVVQTTGHFESNDNLSLLTTLLHSSGQWIRGIMPVKPVKSDPQGMGSAISYARRYALAAIVGVYQVDDDAEGAQGRTQGLPRVAPEQPEPGDGIPDDSYSIPFGKYMKRRLEEVDVNDLRSYVSYLEKSAVEKNKPNTGQVAEFIERAVAHVAAFENQK